MKNLSTGAAGFISNFVAPRLCQQGHDVMGLDHIMGYQITVSDNMGFARKMFICNKACGF